MHELAAGVHEVLAVVHDEQQFLGAEVVDEPVESRNVGPLGDLEDVRHCGRHGRRFRTRSHVDEPDASTQAPT